MLPSRTFLAGAAVAGALAALPAAANAAEVTQAANGEIVVRDSGSEANDIRLTFDKATNRMGITDSRALRLNTDTCVLVSVGNVDCPRIGLRLELGGGNDNLRTTNDLLANVLMGAGDDAVTIGANTGASNIDLSGGAGTDTVSYDGQGRAVRIEKDNLRNDGRAGDADNIRTDVETLVGTIFDDVLIGWAGEDILDAGLGNDTMAGVSGTNTFRTRGVADGADNLIGGTGYDYADYRRRTDRVLLSVDGAANDGAPGEGDNLGGIEALMSGSGNDVLRGGGQFASVLQSGAGNDFLFGGTLGDYLDGGAGQDGLAAGAGADSLIANDGELDDLQCGAGTDSIQRDARETQVKDCETGVGVARFAQRRDVVKVSWTHPRAWKALKQVRIELVDGDRLPVGAVVIKPASGKVKASGVAGKVKLTREGKTVTARIAVKAGERRLGAEVEAVQRNGRSQLAVF